MKRLWINTQMSVLKKAIKDKHSGTRSPAFVQTRSGDADYNIDSIVEAVGNKTLIPIPKIYYQHYL